MCTALEPHLKMCECGACRPVLAKTPHISGRSRRPELHKQSPRWTACEAVQDEALSSWLTGTRRLGRFCDAQLTRLRGRGRLTQRAQHRIYIARNPGPGLHLLKPRQRVDLRVRAVPPGFRQIVSMPCIMHLSSSSRGRLACRRNRHRHRQVRQGRREIRIWCSRSSCTREAVSVQARCTRGGYHM